MMLLVPMAATYYQFDRTLWWITDELGDIRITEDLAISQIAIDKVTMIQTTDMVNCSKKTNFKNRVVLQDSAPETKIEDHNHHGVITFVINDEDPHLDSASVKIDPDRRLDSKHVFKVKYVHHRETKSIVKGLRIHQRRVIKRATRRLKMCHKKLSFHQTYLSQLNHPYQTYNHLHLHLHHNRTVRGNVFNHQLLTKLKLTAS